MPTAKATVVLLLACWTSVNAACRDECRDEVDEHDKDAFLPSACASAAKRNMRTKNVSRINVLLELPQQQVWALLLGLVQQQQLRQSLEAPLGLLPLVLWLVAFLQEHRLQQQAVLLVVD